MCELRTRIIEFTGCVSGPVFMVQVSSDNLTWLPASDLFGDLKSAKDAAQWIREEHQALITKQFKVIE